jgi:hypothetical protein
MPLPLIALAVGAAGAIQKVLRRRNNLRNADDNDRWGKEIETIVEKVADRPSDPPKQGPSTAKPALLFKVLVTSEPSGAQISVDRDYLSDTPFEIPLTRGKHKISIKIDRRKRWQNTVRVVGDGQKIHAELKKSWL